MGWICNRVRWISQKQHLWLLAALLCLQSPVAILRIFKIMRNSLFFHHVIYMILYVQTKISFYSLLIFFFQNPSFSFYGIHIKIKNVQIQETICFTPHAFFPNIWLLPFMKQQYFWKKDLTSETSEGVCLTLLLVL